jgi:hypothetical protein
MNSKKLFLIAISIIVISVISSCNSNLNENKKAKVIRTDTTAISIYKSISDTLTDEAVKKIEYLNTVARFIAGLPALVKSPLDTFYKTLAWKKYAKESVESWKKFNNYTKSIKQWSKTEINPSVDSIKTLFYPFSGPDFLFADMIFPKVEKIVMIGLESPGSIPQFDMSLMDSLHKVFNLYNTAIEDVINLSFFKTKNMKDELSNKTINGTTPILMLFLANSGKLILEVNPKNLNNEGKLVNVRKGSLNYSTVEIKYKNPGDSIIRTIYYLSTNLADPALQSNKPFRLFLKNIDNNCVSFVKSASYLMHKSYFSIIRKTILNKSAFILQDDSGIAFKYYDRTQWNIQLYGIYQQPIDLFKEFYENDLNEAYQESQSKPLNFKMGYNSKANLLFAIKK